jgi:dihydrofolate reductase
MLYSIIIACTIDGGIGLNNQIPWNIKEEMQLFRKITADINCYIKKNAVIMGRKTWESIPNKPLKNRINIIITSDPLSIKTNHENIFVFNNLDDAFSYCRDNIYIDKVFVIGGKSLYDLCLNTHKYSKDIENIHLSIIKQKYKCDTYIDFRKIIKTYRNYNIHDIIFNANFIYIKLLNPK